MRFDYLHSAPAMLLQRLLEIRIPQHLHNALSALAAAAIVVAGAWTIDCYRLREALRVETVYRQRYAEIDRARKRTNVYYERVRALVALDKRVRKIAASGDADARILAEIANRLPAHAWLTGISHDGTGIALDGRAKDLRVLSGVMQGLMHAKHLRSPMLVSAVLDKDLDKRTAIKYEIHVEAAAP